MTPLETAAALAAPIGALGGRWMLDPATFARGAEIGFPPGFEYYAMGRLGVLGDVTPGVVVAGAVMFEPGLVAQLWAKARTLGEPAAVSAHYATACHEWGRQHLGGNDGLDRVAELLDRVVSNASVAGLPLFAGWQAMERPDDGPAAACQLIHTMRELRFGNHSLAVLAEGLTPIEAVLAGPGGAGNAAMFGWAEPYPEITEEIRDRRAAAESRTNALVAPALTILSGDERSELVQRIVGLEVS